MPTINNTEIEVVTVQYAFCKQDDGYIPVEDCKQCVYCEIVGEKMYCKFFTCKSGE